MNILIFTSSNHIYANFVLKTLFEKKVFSSHKVTVWEQGGVLPKKSIAKGAYTYLCISGPYYTVMQICKYFLFIVCRFIAFRRNNKQSPFYPYSAYLKSGDARACCPRLLSRFTYEQVRGINPDIILSIYSKDIIPAKIFRFPRFGCVNLHPAPLPDFRGVSPTFWILANGEKKAGATLHKVDRGIDTGEIICQKIFYTNKFQTEHGLYMHASSQGASLVRLFISGSRNNKNYSVITRKKTITEGSYYSLPTKESVNRFLKNGYRLFDAEEFIYST